jgi:hypothetical protein
MGEEDRGRMPPTMSRYFSIAGIRKIGTSLAAFLLVFPMLAVVSPTLTPDCCNGKMCPVHHKHPMSSNTSENSHMDCEHGEMGLTPCSMSCGRSDEIGPQTTVVFLPPGESRSIALVPVERAPLGDFACSSDLAIRPLIPPPRFLASL